MMENWPSYAKIQISGFSEEVDFGVIRTDMDSAYAKQRSRFSKGIVSRECTVLFLTLADRNAFKTWVKTGLRSGVDFFQWNDPLDNATQKLARIVNGKVSYEPQGGSMHLAKFTMETIG